MGVLHMPTPAGHHPLKSCPRHEAPPQIILKSVTFTMTTDSPSRAPPLEDRLDLESNVLTISNLSLGHRQKAKTSKAKMQETGEGLRTRAQRT